MAWIERANVWRRQTNLRTWAKRLRGSPALGCVRDNASCHSPIQSGQSAKRGPSQKWWLGSHPSGVRCSDPMTIVKQILGTTEQGRTTTATPALLSLLSSSSQRRRIMLEYVLVIGWSRLPVTLNTTNGRAGADLLLRATKDNAPC